MTNWKHRVLTSLIVSSVAITASLATGAAVAAGSESLSNAMDLRALYGLPPSESHVKSLMGSAKDVGSKQFDIPMTAAEVKQVDPNGRAIYSDFVNRNVIPWLEEQPTCAGAWLDRSGLGRRPAR